MFGLRLGLVPSALILIFIYLYCNRLVCLTSAHNLKSRVCNVQLIKCNSLPKM